MTNGTKKDGLTKAQARELATKVARQLRGRAAGTRMRTYTDRMASEDMAAADLLEALGGNADE